MERSEWLAEMRAKAEALYDHLAPAYWVKFGQYPNETHREFIAKFLKRLAARSRILDAACGAGRYDGMLLEAGHSVLGIDQSSAMLARAREVLPEGRFPDLQFAKVRLQDMDFEARFDGAICIDALEHVCPEDWPGIVARFHKALKPDGVLYVTVEVAEQAQIAEDYERAKDRGLPVVLGEVVSNVDSAYAKVAALDWQAISGEQAAPAVYHFYPPAEQVRLWFQQARLTIDDEAIADDYWHILAHR